MSVYTPCIYILTDGLQVHNPEFNSKDIDPDLHKRMDKAVQDGRIKCFSMRESDAEGDQDLHL